LLSSGAAKAEDPEIDHLLQSPVGKDWVTKGGNLTNQRYSTLRRSTPLTSSSSRARG
jgi:quinohemoprotein ethanol dehydrogenase